MLKYVKAHGKLLVILIFCQRLHVCEYVYITHEPNSHIRS